MSDIGRVYGGNHIGKLRSPDKATRTAAIMAQSPNMSKQDAARLAHRQWVENPEMRQGKVTTGDLYKDYSLSVASTGAKAKASALGNAEGVMLGMYGTNGVAYGQNLNREKAKYSLPTAELEFKRLVSADIMDRTRRRAMEFDLDNKYEDRERSLKESDLRIAKFKQENALNAQTMAHNEQNMTLAAENRAKAEQQAQAKAEAAKKKEFDDAYNWIATVPHLAAKLGISANSSIFDSKERFEMFQGAGGANKTGKTIKINGADYVFLSDGNIAPVSYPKEQTEAMPNGKNGVFDENTRKWVYPTIVVNGIEVHNAAYDALTARKKGLNSAEEQRDSSNSSFDYLNTQ